MNRPKKLPTGAVSLLGPAIIFAVYENFGWSIYLVALETTMCQLILDFQIVRFAIDTGQ